MKLKLTIFLLTISLSVCGQSNNWKDSNSTLLKRFPYLSIRDTLLHTDIVGCYKLIKYGVLNTKLNFDFAEHFQLISQSESFSKRDIGTWKISNHDILQFTSFEGLNLYQLIKFDRYLILVPKNKIQKFFSDLGKAWKQIEKQQKKYMLATKTLNALIIQELILTYYVRDPLETCP